MTTEDLIHVKTIRQAWNRATSASPERWTPQNPALGQCAVTALVVQDALGGDLLRTIVNGESHYFNRLIDGGLIDLTFEQFGDNPITDGAYEERTREYVVSYPDTYFRYRLLLERCANINYLDYFLRIQ